MKACLPRANPFAVDAWFDSSCTLTFAVPAEDIAARLPSCLVPDTYEDRWGFVAVAVVQTRKLRPAVMPAIFGHDFVLAGYRYFVRYRSASGRNLRGLFIVRSETDKRHMEWLGNFFTRYKYVKTDIRVTRDDRRIDVRSPDTGLEIEVEISPGCGLPDGSPFTRWEDARRFSGPLPFTFTCEREKNRVLIVEGVRSHWQPRPVRVIHQRIPHLQTLGLGHAVLANAFIVENIPYHWKAGAAEPWPDP
ncbi:MAG: DUF2071 domain-containing protein [Luteolibacter sp.]